jgi:NAD(P)-dependent dehydrogenase (short-subunit alcohol dehydrogenase family)
LEKVLLIFGADGNLGKVVSNTLAKKGFDKAFLFGMKDYSEPISGNNFYTKVNDLSDEVELAGLFADLKTSRENLYFLFSTIGGYSGGKNIWQTDYKEWNKMFILNINISFLIAKHFARLVEKSAGGSICFTTALTSLKAENKKSAYGASKAALNYLVKTLALEGREINLSANAIAPFILDTEENRKWVNDKTDLIKLDEIGKLVYSLFENYKIVSGNIIELPYNLAV